MSGTGGDATTAPIVRRRIRQIRYDEACIPLVAELLGGAAGLADFRLPSAAVHQITIPGERGAAAVMLTLWTSIRRVDAIGLAATIVFTDVATVDLVEEVEVQFRRGNRDYLIITRGGKIIVRA